MRSSLGVRRYVEGVISHLEWSGGIESLTQGRFEKFGRIGEFLEVGNHDEILWTPCQRGSIIAPHHVVTIHDCINIEYIYRNDLRLPVYRKFMEILFSRAEVVVAISFATRDAILRNFSLSADRIQVIQSGMNPISTHSLPEKKVGGRPFVLFVTNDLPHKNTIAACRAWAQSRGPVEGIMLRVIGKLPNEAIKVCQGIPFLHQNGLTDMELAIAYRDCCFLIAPSLSEGHNLPIAEALSLGAEVICSDIDVHHEYYDGRVRYFDPLRSESILNSINEALALSLPWFRRPAYTLRTFADVASDYAKIFAKIQKS
jgi:glycosyltransferase involved in cell wall biosynthesis